LRRSSAPRPSIGAADEPQLPVTSVVTPCRTRESAVGYTKMSPSEWVWMSMKPGHTTWLSGVEHAPALLGGDRADRGDRAPAHGEVRGEAGRTGAVEQRAAADHQLEARLRLHAQGGRQRDRRRGASALTQEAAAAHPRTGVGWP
jgi:hypothetical protein